MRSFLTVLSTNKRTVKLAQNSTQLGLLPISDAYLCFRQSCQVLMWNIVQRNFGRKEFSLTERPSKARRFPKHVQKTSRLIFVLYWSNYLACVEREKLTVQLEENKVDSPRRCMNFRCLNSKHLVRAAVFKIMISKELNLLDLFTKTNPRWTSVESLFFFLFFFYFRLILFFFFFFFHLNLFRCIFTVWKGCLLHSSLTLMETEGIPPGYCQNCHTYNKLLSKNNLVTF